MTVKLTAQPFCRNCGKPIPKATDTHYFGSPTRVPAPGTLPQTKAEAMRLVNQQIVSIQRWVMHRDPDDNLPTGRDDPNVVRTDLGIRAVGLWDGESYRDAYFDSNGCAIAFARSIAKTTNYATDAYRAAVKAAADKKKERA